MSPELEAECKAWRAIRKQLLKKHRSRLLKRSKVGKGIGEAEKTRQTHPRAF